MTDTLPRAENPTRHLTLQYLLLAFSQLHVRHEALRCLDDLLTFLAGAPHEPMPDGRTRGELAAEYLDGLSRDGRCRDCELQWLHDDPEFQDTLEHHGARLAAAGIRSVPEVVDHR